MSKQEAEKAIAENEVEVARLRRNFGTGGSYLYIEDNKLIRSYAAGGHIFREIIAQID
jgi:hypothetical protein